VRNSRLDPHHRPTPVERWFGRLIWLGVLANLALAIPTVLFPSQLLAMAELPQATPVVWPRFAGLLLVLLSAFYVSAARDWGRHGLAAWLPAWLSVVSRLVGVLFFLGFQDSEYRMMGLFDLMFFVPQATLLLWAASTAAPVMGAATEPV